ncbi:hypothetical protein KR222_004435 [Zaprionus bogoriensis]|nr:hypothetical protein KR222_004435 [Zaprionus bogoriensis]
MLNGKFYTGLPPKMVERQGGHGQNRQQSHFFWPDDTQVDSSVETRVRRRGSLQQESAQVQPVVVAQASSPDVDTRQMFHKEFAKSSIQFHDNLQSSQSNQSRLNRARREVTPKLTDVSPQQRPPLATGQQLLEADPSAARRKQAYSSKIEFYDYVNLNDAANNTQNNVRRPKMDMNNKREVELNSKNSPKLQVKHNVRQLNIEREQLPPPTQLRVVTKKPLNDGGHWQREQYEATQRQLPKKKILKPQRSQQWLEEGAHVDMPDMADMADMDYMDNGVRQLRLRSPAPTKKHVTYNEEAAEYAYYDELPQPDEALRQLRPNMRTGSAQQQHQKQQQQKQPRPYGETGRDTKTLNNYNKNFHNNYDDYSSNYNNNSSSSSNSYNNYSSRSRKILPKLPELATTTTTTTTIARTMRSRRCDDTLAAEATPATTVAPTELPSPSDPRKHLRSSLCFNGDALVVDVGAAAPSSASSSAAGLARRSSAGQRVSVGLPD